VHVVVVKFTEGSTIFSSLKEKSYLSVEYRGLLSHTMEDAGERSQKSIAIASDLMPMPTSSPGLYMLIITSLTHTASVSMRPQCSRSLVEPCSHSPRLLRGPKNTSRRRQILMQRECQVTIGQLIWLDRGEGGLPCGKVHARSRTVTVRIVRV